MEKLSVYIRIVVLTFLLVTVAQAIYPTPPPSIGRGAATATFSHDGTLRIRGGDAKGDYDLLTYDFVAPSDLRHSVIRLVIEENVPPIELWRVFIGSERLTSIEAAIGNAYYCSDNGVLFNKDKTVLMWYPSGKQGAYTIPNSVTKIEEDAFSGSVGLTSVTIPNTVTYIGVSAFIGCTGLKSVVIPNSVTSIGDGAFMYCTGLKTIMIPNSVIRINDNTFLYCTGLQSISIPNSIIEIHNEAFAECSTLTSVTIPNNVISIGWRAFDGCTGLNSITIQNSNPPSIEGGVFRGINTNRIHLIVPKGSVDTYRAYNVWNTFQIVEDTANYSSKNGVVFNKDKTELIRYPESKKGSYKIPNSVTSIGSRAFVSCTGLRSVTIPNSVTSIGIAAFCDCIGLKTVTIPNSVTSLGEGTFYGCTGLRSVTIPNSVTSIGKAAFYGCTGLKSVTIPNSVTEIEESAFDGCDNLTSMIVRSSTPPKNIQKCVDNARVDLYVPKGSVDDYHGVSKTMRYFKSIQEIPDGIEDTNGNSGGVWIALGILSALVLSLAVFVVTKK